MKNKLVKIRLVLDGLAQLTKKIKSVKVDLGQGNFTSKQSKELEGCTEKLLFAKAHLGKVLGGVKTNDILSNGDEQPEPEISVIAIAKACHEANKAYCESIGDNSQPSWEDAPNWQTESAIKGVEFAIANPNATPADMHQSWTDQKVSEGWVYGEVKDAEAKTHPCLVPYNELPEQQREKDSIFQRTVKSFLTPYANEGTRKTVSDIEPTAEKASEGQIELPENFSELSEIEVIDWLRNQIGKVSEEIIAVEKNAEEFPMELMGHLAIAYMCAAEARFWLGFELERMREQA